MLTFRGGWRNSNGRQFCWKTLQKTDIEPGNSKCPGFTSAAGDPDMSLVKTYHVALQRSACAPEGPCARDPPQIFAHWQHGPQRHAVRDARKFEFSTMWMEGVWEIVRATLRPTKFIVTDDPVTFYCKTVFPRE
jgi:hypothetical protein